MLHLTFLTLIPVKPKLSHQPSIMQTLNIDKFISSLQSLNKIIQRDFFPELPKLQAQHEYLDAVEHNDVEKLREISARYQVTHTPGGRLGTYTIFKQNISTLTFSWVTTS